VGSLPAGMRSHLAHHKDVGRTLSRSGTVDVGLPFCNMRVALASPVTLACNWRLACTPPRRSVSAFPPLYPSRHNTSCYTNTLRTALLLLARRCRGITATTAFTALTSHASRTFTRLSSTSLIPPSTYLRALNTAPPLLGARARNAHRAQNTALRAAMPAFARLEPLPAPRRTAACLLAAATTTHTSLHSTCYLPACTLCGAHSPFAALNIPRTHAAYHAAFATRLAPALPLLFLRHASSATLRLPHLAHALRLARRASTLLLAL